MNRRIGVLLAGAALVTTALAGCASGGTDESGDAGTTRTAMTTPGNAACDLVTGPGSVTLQETADAYRVEWTGVPVDADDNRTTYEVQLGNDEMQGGVDLCRVRHRHGDHVRRRTAGIERRRPDRR